MINIWGVSQPTSAVDVHMDDSLSGYCYVVSLAKPLEVGSLLPIFLGASQGATKRIV
jgi:hypothetical protein